jgi:hypothetical protein
MISHSNGPVRKWGAKDSIIIIFLFEYKKKEKEKETPDIHTNHGPQIDLKSDLDSD